MKINFQKSYLHIIEQKVTEATESLLEFKGNNNGKFQPKSNKVDRLYRRKLY